MPGFTDSVVGVILGWRRSWELRLRGWAGLYSYVSIVVLGLSWLIHSA
jgi:hypothetical protein